MSEMSKSAHGCKRRFIGPSQEFCCRVEGRLQEFASRLLQLNQSLRPTTCWPIHSRPKVQTSLYLKVRTPPQAWEAVLAGVQRGGPGLFQGGNTGSNPLGTPIFFCAGSPESHSDCGFWRFRHFRKHPNFIERLRPI